MREQLDALYGRLSAKQRQWFTVAVLCGGLFFLLWLVFSISGKSAPGGVQPANMGGQKATAISNVMASGQQVDPRDRWVGEAGREIAEYRANRASQDQFNQDVLNRFKSLEKLLTERPAAAPAVSTPVAPAMPPALHAAPQPGGEVFPPQGALASPANIPPIPAAASRLPPSNSRNAVPLIEAPAVGLTRMSMQRVSGQSAPTAPSKSANDAKGQSANDYLPVSFTQAILLGGLDAPTGGHAQTNPQPVLLKLEDNAVLPNRFRSQVKECFVVAAGYGDISSERAYMRTENLSCIRNDGSALEVKIQGSVFGEDGKVGVRGRLVEKQGQLLARALMAGIASGIGQAFGNNVTTLSVSPLGATQTVDAGKSLEYGLSVGVGKALDRLAQYYIKMAETIFPVIEVDAGRRVDVVITKGVVIDAPINGPATRPMSAPRFDQGRLLTSAANDDED